MLDRTKRISCLLVEDEALSIEMMQDYIGRRHELELVAIASEMSEIQPLVAAYFPAIIFLDLVLPIGKSTGFHFGMLPQTASIVIVSGVPLTHYHGELPKGKIFELPKPVSFESFERCVDEVLLSRLSR
ncbi:hypothetical protein FXV77_05305 [Sphingobacterium phlebotomi]|uniref:Response regulatory domain-containing protein n=1 Tax=Sphingobacterium phlebotomi TaxID=2605433 RepID=A0A5D4HAR8_9SPHI|nr:hypothetical protein [Sphingobacterium phlebotomi]TYR37422.1 hypothetical protein FXV77_05305 [Sphingobacterium phlebotomi]